MSGRWSCGLTSIRCNEMERHTDVMANNLLSPPWVTARHTAPRDAIETATPIHRLLGQMNRVVSVYAAGRHVTVRDG